MTVGIDLDNKTIEELEHYKSVIENKIAKKEKEQERQRDMEMLKTYRKCLIRNVTILIFCNPKIKDEKCGLKIFIENFLKSTDKPLWLKENFLTAISFLTLEIKRQYKTMPNTVLDRKETLFVLGEFLRALEKIEVE